MDITEAMHLRKGDIVRLDLNQKNRERVVSRYMLKNGFLQIRTSRKTVQVSPFQRVGVDYDEG